MNYKHFHYLTNRIIFNNKRQEVCGKKKREEENLPASLLFSLTFLILSHLTVSVCLLVSRVRAYLSTNQQHGIPCLIKRGPLPDWPVWTRGLMVSGAAAERENCSVEGQEGQFPPSSFMANSLPPSSLMAKGSPWCLASQGTVRRSRERLATSKSAK